MSSWPPSAVYHIIYHQKILDYGMKWYITKTFITQKSNILFSYRAYSPANIISLVINWHVCGHACWCGISTSSYSLKYLQHLRNKLNVMKKYYTLHNGILLETIVLIPHPFNNIIHLSHILLPKKLCAMRLFLFFRKWA